MRKVSWAGILGQKLSLTPLNFVELGHIKFIAFNRNGAHEENWASEPPSCDSAYSRWSNF